MEPSSARGRSASATATLLSPSSRRAAAQRAPIARQRSYSTTTRVPRSHIEWSTFDPLDQLEAAITTRFLHGNDPDGSGSCEFPCPSNMRTDWQTD